MSVSRRREERLEVRLSTTVKNTLQQAASLQQKTISHSCSIVAWLRRLKHSRTVENSRFQRNNMMCLTCSRCSPEAQAAPRQGLNTPSVLEE